MLRVDFLKLYSIVCSFGMEFVACFLKRCS